MTLGRTILILVIILLIAMAPRKAPNEIRYVVLGDSYTFGESINSNESWPALLTKDLIGRGVKVKLVANLAKTGKATTEVISEQLPVFSRLSPTFATVLVGVNDFNRGYSAESFRRNLGTILDSMLAKLPKDRLVVVTIPDFSVTPVGKMFGDPQGNSLGIKKFNGIIKGEAAKRNLPVVDVYALSQEMGKDETLVAGDGLHPSGKEYKLWEERILPEVLGLLKRG